MIKEICEKAKIASYEMGKLSADAKNVALGKMADALEANMERILEANKEDVAALKPKASKQPCLTGCLGHKKSADHG